MKNIKISNDIVSSKIAYGCMRIGNKSKEEAKTAVLTALDCGINFFDNADIYCKGESEICFGNAVRDIDRDSIIVQSKCGIRSGYYDFSKEHIVTSVEKSLGRMGLDYLDVLCLHRPDALLEGEEVADAFENLHSRGLAKNFGVSNFNPMQVELLKKYIDYPLIVNQLQLGIFHTGMIDSWMCANMDNSFAVDKDGSILPYSMLNDMVIQAWGPMRSGKKFLPDDERVPLLQTWADKYSISVEALAIAWINRLSCVQPIIGTTNPQRIKNILKCCDTQISREDWYKIYKDMGNLVP
jgi:predicted oxidoreductase